MPNGFVTEKRWIERALRVALKGAVPVVHPRSKFRVELCIQLLFAGGVMAMAGGGTEWSVPRQLTDSASLASKLPLPRSGDSYLGSGACRSCHEDEYRIPRPVQRRSEMLIDPEGKVMSSRVKAILGARDDRPVSINE